MIKRKKVKSAPSPLGGMLIPAFQVPVGVLPYEKDGDARPIRVWFKPYLTPKRYRVKDDC